MADLAGYENKVYATNNNTFNYRGTARARYIDTSGQNFIDAANSTLFYRLRNLRLEQNKKLLLHAIGEGNAIYRNNLGRTQIDSPGGVFELGTGKLVRFSSTSLEFSLDGGTTWKTVTAT